MTPAEIAALLDVEERSVEDSHEWTVGQAEEIRSPLVHMWRNMYGEGSCTSGMATEDAPEETKVSDRGMVTIPASLRRRLDIEAGDKLRWNVEDEGSLSVEVVRQRYGAFEDDDLKADLGGDSLETHDTAGYEPAPAENS